MSNHPILSIRRLLLTAGVTVALGASALGQGTQDTSNNRSDRAQARRQAQSQRFDEPTARRTDDLGRGSAEFAPQFHFRDWRDLDRRLTRIEDELEDIRRLLEILVRDSGRDLDDDPDDGFRIQPDRRDRLSDDNLFDPGRRLDDLRSADERSGRSTRGDFDGTGFRTRRSPAEGAFERGTSGVRSGTGGTGRGTTGSGGTGTGAAGGTGRSGSNP